MYKVLKKGINISLLFLMVFFITALLEVRALAFEKSFSNSIGMKFLYVPAGTFIMGSPLQEPHRYKNEIQHQVSITKPFYIQSTEVTLRHWRTLMGKRFFSRRKGKNEMPVVEVSWYDCMKFIKKLNAMNEGAYRLPTEAEWEYACRAGSKSAYSWGDNIDCRKAMYGNNHLDYDECVECMRLKGITTDFPAPVKSFQPNAWGLYDMHGNVWEWCADWYGGYSEKALKDPYGPDSGDNKVRRGGSWFKYGYSCRSANRAHGNPSTRYRTTGFRLVREVN